MSFLKLVSISFLYLSLILKPNLYALIDLEENCQDFILETKRIILKNYENAFNPSIIRWQGQLIMTFRLIPNPILTFNSQIGIVLLDENFEPTSTVQILDTQDKRSLVPSRAEDARLITIKDKLYLVYSDNKDDYISRGGFRVYVSELKFDDKSFSVGSTDCLKDFEGASSYIREKNWVPFEYNGLMMLAYSLTPHKIFRYFSGSEKCETISLTSSVINWEYGELRGGTAALLDGDNYLSFFHSSIDMLTAHSNGRKISHYFMGAYTFSSSPPFEINSISKEPIIGKGFYKGEYYKPYWKSVRCIFPCGMIIEDPYIYVSYGRQDHEIWIVKMDKQMLIDSLETVSKK
jgi:predicted GH43/DUF377 family glycosyl hydrolase